MTRSTDPLGRLVNGICTSKQEPLPGVDLALAELSNRYRLVLITKGDLLDQERKLAQSGLGDLFHGVEIVSDKTAARDTLKAQGIVMLDCPLSGTGAQAVHKDLTVYASGPKAAIKQLAPVFEGFSKSTFDLGAFGKGMKMKLMANLLVAIHNVSTAEALLLGQRWGIRPQDAVKVLSDGAGGSRMLQVRGPLMEGEGWHTATMKVGIWQKDMKLIAAALADAQVPAPLFAATVPVYNAAMALGHAEHDTAAVFDVLSRMSS